MKLLFAAKQKMVVVCSICLQKVTRIVDEFISYWTSPLDYLKSSLKMDMGRLRDAKKKSCKKIFI